jgi:hypothetical protein
VAVYTETWTGSNGDPWPAIWTATAGGAGGVVDIQSNVGRLASPTAANTGNGAVHPARHRDFDVTVDAILAGTATQLGMICFRTTAAFVSGRGYPTDGYIAMLATTTSALEFYRIVGSSLTFITTTPYTGTGGTTITVRAQMIGSAFKMKAWHTTSDLEPAGWAIETTDSTITTAGYLALSTDSTSSASENWGWDNLSFTGLGGDEPGTYLKSLGTAASNANGTTLAISFTGAAKPQVGDLVVVYCARDNTTNDPATGDSFDDAEGNTYSRVALAQPSGTSTQAAGITGVMFYTVVTAAWTGTNTLTWTLPSRTGKVMFAEHFQGPVVGLRGTADTAGATAGTVTVATTDPLAGDLVCAMSAYEHSAASTVTADSDTTNGSWSTQTAELASGGTTTAAVKIVGQRKLVTATGTQSYATSNSTTSNVDTVGIVATFIPGYSYRGRQPTPPAGGRINSNFY